MDKLVHQAQNKWEDEKFIPGAHLRERGQKTGSFTAMAGMVGNIPYHYFMVRFKLPRCKYDT